MKRINIMDNENVQVSELNKTIEILRQLDDKIVDLQQYSSNDFSFLNQKFLSFHKKTKNIVEQVENYRKNIWSESFNDNKSLSKLVGHSKEMTPLINEIKKKFSIQIENYKELYEKLGFIHVPLSNYKQNLFTLKLLSTNLKIDKLALLKRERITDKVDDLILILESISMFFPKINKFIEGYLIEIDEVINELKGCLNSCYIIEEDLGQFLRVNELINNKICEVKEINKKFEDHRRMSNQNVETIITKLQYQDIIRQRIEHIQETHNEMIANLMNLTEEKELETDQTEIVMQVKDIVGLQSAHLIHINHEFQKAIEKLSDTLKEYNNNISALTNDSISLIESFNDYSIRFEISFEQISPSAKKFPEIENRISTLFDRVNIIENKSDELLGNFDDIKGISERMEKVGNSIHESPARSTLSKITELLKDNMNLSVKINDQIEDFVNIHKNIKNNQFQHVYNDICRLRENTGNIKGNAIKDKIDDILEKSKEVNKQIKDYKYEQKIVSSALHELQYYQYFEKSINEIKRYLDDISKYFSKILESVKGDTDKNIEHVKQRYTTSTEHYVHSEFSNNATINSNIILNQNDDELDNNVEFF